MKLLRFSILFLPFSLGTLLSQAFADLTETAQIKIGIIIPLTGPASDFGVAVRNGAIWGAEGTGRSQIKWLVEDVPFSSAAAVTAFHKLTSIDHVDAVYAWGAPFCSALSELAEQKQIPFFGQCVVERTSQSKLFVMRFMNGAAEYMGANITVLKEMGFNAPAIVTSDWSYDEELTAAFTNRFSQLIPSGSIVSLDRVASTEQEFRPIIARLKTRSPSAVLALLGTGRIGIFLKQAREQGMSIPTFVSNSAESSSERAAAAGSFRGTYFINNHVSQDFADKYRQKFGTENQMAFAALAFEFGRMTNEVLSRCSECRGMALLDAYKRLSPWKGKAAGDALFIDTPTTGGYWQYPLVLKRVVEDVGGMNERVVELKQIEIPLLAP